MIHGRRSFLPYTRAILGLVVTAAVTISAAPQVASAQPKPAAPPAKPPAGDDTYDTPKPPVGDDTYDAPKPVTPYDEDKRTPEQKALDRYNDGVKFAKKEDWPHAYDALLDAWKTFPAVVIAVNLAKAEIETERYRDAVEHSQYCLENAKPNSGNRALAEKWILEAQEKGPKVELTSDIEGASIFLDSVLIGTTPAKEPILLNVGDHTIEIVLGERRARTAVTAEPGVTTKVLLRLPPPPVVVVPTVAPTPPPPSPPPSPNMAVLVTGGIVGVAGLSLGLVGAVLVQDAKRIRDDECARQIRSAGEPCWERQEATRALSAQLATGGFITAGAGVLVTVVYYLASKPAAFTSAARPVSLSPLLSPTFGGFGVSGNW